MWGKLGDSRKPQVSTPLLAVSGTKKRSMKIKVPAQKKEIGGNEWTGPPDEREGKPEDTNMIQPNQVFANPSKEEVTNPKCTPQQ
jgi:hypothetical protein